MVDFNNYWTFPVPGKDFVLVFASDWEGLLLLNPTASWIWQNAKLANLPHAYSNEFGISLAQAEEDIRLTFESWSHWKPPPIPAVPATLDIPSGTAQYSVGDSAFYISFATAGIAEELIPRLEQIELKRPSETVRPVHSFHLCETPEGTAIYRDGDHIATEALVTGARAVLLQELTRLAVPGREFNAILHAGAVGNQDRCVILAGASFSGKSTLCAALMQSGLLCYSDDSACLTTDFEVAGMPFALSLREGSWHLFPHLERPRFMPSNLNGTSPTAPPVALIFVDYRPDAVATTFEPVAMFDALVALQESGFWVEHSKPAITAFLDWISRLPIYRLRYSKINEAIAQVHSLLNSAMC